MSSMLTTSFGQMRASAAEVRNPQATLTVDLDPAVNTGDIVHGAAGFLYGVSSEDVPTTNTIVPLKSKILVTKGALGTEHPYGDALDVAKTFLESGGEQVQMYNSNYYGVVNPTSTIEQYCSDLEKYICPGVVAGKKPGRRSTVLPRLQKITLEPELISTRRLSMSLSMRAVRLKETFLKHGRVITKLSKLLIPMQKLQGPTILNMVGERRAEILRIIFSSVQTTTVCLTLSHGMSCKPIV